MTKPATARVDQLLSSMGYGSRKDMARMAKAGGISLDGGDQPAHRGHARFAAPDAD